MASVLKTSGETLSDIQNGIPDTPVTDTRERGIDASAAPAAGASPAVTSEGASQTTTPTTQNRVSLGSSYSAPAPSNPLSSPYGRYLNPILGGAEDVGKQTEAVKGSFYQ